MPVLEDERSSGLWGFERKNLEIEPEGLVYAEDHGLIGSNYYYNVLTEEEREEVGLTDKRVRVHAEIVIVLKKINEELREYGYCIYIKEGYRSDAVYDIAYRKCIEEYGQERADKLFNMENRPHSTGKTVDLVLWDLETNTQVMMRDGNEEPESFFVDFYRNKKDKKKIDILYQRRQYLLIKIMQRNGFRLGTKNEYWHFDFKPDTEPNY